MYLIKAVRKNLPDTPYSQRYCSAQQISLINLHLHSPQCVFILWNVTLLLI